MSNATTQSVQHTPGPWTRGTDGERMRHDHSAPVRSANGMHVAAALDFNNYDRDAEVEANARLIAAAPELLEALNRLVIEAVDQGWEDHGRVDSTLEMARAAIRRAEGRPAEVEASHD